MKKLLLILMITFLTSSALAADDQTVIMNTKTYIYHTPDCKWAKLITGMPQFNGYIAQVGLACAEKDGPYRGAGFYIKFNGIEKIYSAHRDTGHGYGIEIKIK